MNKYLVSIEFRYHDAPKSEHHGSFETKTITIGVFDDFDTACVEGNKSLELLESKFKLNPNYNVRERFSKNGGCFGSKKTLITNLGYLRTPFEFYAKITTLKHESVLDTVNDVMNARKRYSKYKKSLDD